jgi:hypothetical protein
MWSVIFGIFIVLHGVVHLMYAGHSQRLFELVPGMTWPDESWAFSGMPGQDSIRTLATVLLVLTALGLLAGGVGIAAARDGQPLVVNISLSNLVFLLLWNGKSQRQCPGWPRAARQHSFQTPSHPRWPLV